MHLAPLHTVSKYLSPHLLPLDEPPAEVGLCTLNQVDP
jgi:hypothetical protein